MDFGIMDIIFAVLVPIWHFVLLQSILWVVNRFVQAKKIQFSLLSHPQFFSLSFLFFWKWRFSNVFCCLQLWCSAPLYPHLFLCSDISFSRIRKNKYYHQFLPCTPVRKISWGLWPMSETQIQWGPLPNTFILMEMGFSTDFLTTSYPGIKKV